MTDTGTLLLNSILAHPEEDTPRLMYADWLTENDQPEYAEFIRVQVELARETVGWKPENLHCLDTYLEPQDDESQTWKHRVNALRARERQLLDWNGAGWLRDVGLVPPMLTAGGKYPTGEFRRGFVAHVELPCAPFVADGFAARLFAREPVMAVALTDKVPDERMDGLFFAWRSPCDGERGPEYLPDELYGLLASGEERMEEEDDGSGFLAQLWTEYPTRELARAALSAACVAFGRSAAGLPAI